MTFTEQHWPGWAEVHDAGTPHERYVVDRDDGRLVVHTQGGQVTQWRCAGQDVLWTSETAQYAAGKAIRGGVPVIFPWFGAGPEGISEPAHGFARLARWQPSGWSSEVSGDGVGISLTIEHQDVDGLPGAEQWPYPFRADLSAEMNRDSLTLTLILHNETDRPLTCEAALHTYLAVSDARTASVEGLDGVAYRDKVLGRDAVQNGPVTFGPEVDRPYATDRAVVLRDGARQVGVESTGGTHVVVWNPGAEKGPAMADVSDWTGFVCVETAAIGAGAITIPRRDWDKGLPGIHTLSQTLTLPSR